MNNTDQFSKVSAQFIKDLNQAFPVRDDFTPTTSKETLMYYYGTRKVVRFLESVHQLQNENILKST